MRDMENWARLFQHSGLRQCHHWLPDPAGCLLDSAYSPNTEPAAKPGSYPAFSGQNMALFRAECNIPGGSCGMLTRFEGSEDFAPSSPKQYSLDRLLLWPFCPQSRASGPNNPQSPRNPTRVGCTRRMGVENVDDEAHVVLLFRGGQIWAIISVISIWA